MVVVDVDGERSLLEQRLVDDARLVRAVESDEHPRRVIGGSLAKQPALGQLEKAVLAGKRRRPGEHHRAVLSQRAEGEVHRQE